MANRDVQAEVTARILRALEDGTVPWRKPWTAGGKPPTSVSTGRAYRGINYWTLGLTALEHEYASPYWLTFNQAKQYNGSIRKGEKGTVAVFWKRLKVKDRNDPSKTVDIPLMRGYNVFNLEQTERVLLPKRFAPPEELTPVDVPEAVSSVIDGYVDGPEIRNVLQDRAFYSPGSDVITLPLVAQFNDGPAYAETAFHELVHSTGHASRLDRFASGSTSEPRHFGSERYAREELIAEMGATMLAVTYGIDVPESQAPAYIASWLEVLKNDTSLITKAAQAAQRAVDRIHGTTFERGAE